MPKAEVHGSGSNEIYEPMKRRYYEQKAGDEQTFRISDGLTIGNAVNGYIKCVISGKLVKVKQHAIMFIVTKVGEWVVNIHTKPIIIFTNATAIKQTLFGPVVVLY